MLTRGASIIQIIGSRHTYTDIKAHYYTTIPARAIYVYLAMPQTHHLCHMQQFRVCVGCFSLLSALFVGLGGSDQVLPSLPCKAYLDPIKPYRFRVPYCEVLRCVVDGSLFESFRKLGVPYLGVLFLRILLFRVPYSGPLFSETPI